MQRLTPGSEPRCTLFVSGFPADLKEREVRNFFRFYPSFVGCSLQQKMKEGEHSHYLAFVLFDSEAAAQEVMSLIDGTKFDYHDVASTTIRAFFAKKNLGLPRNYFDQDGLRLNTQDYGYADVGMQQGAYGGHYFTAPPGRRQPQRGYPANQTQYQGHYDTGYDMYGQTQWPGTRQPRKKRKTFSDSNSPSTTLYVSNIAENIGDPEITAMFQSLRGFVAIKIAVKNLHKFCFAEFASLDASEAALKHLDGFTMHQGDPNTALKACYSGTPFKGSRSSASDANTPASTTTSATTPVAAAATVDAVVPAGI